MSDDKPKERSRRRRNVIGSSMHRDEYLRLMKAGWSSATLERYAAWRCGEDIPASTFRQYKKRMKLDVQTSRVLNASFDTDAIPDVLTKRQELIALQTERLAIDAQHERDMRKLFGTTKNEIALLNTLLNELRQDLTDAGVLGEGASQAEPEIELPKHRTLADVLPGDEQGLAEVLHMILPKEA
jgi:hypothetical protein